MLTKIANRQVLWVLAATFLIYFVGFLVPLQEGEAARLAALSVRFWKSGPFDNTPDPELSDQPLLLLWVFALFTKVFGENHIAYRLPGIIAILWALYSVSHFCKIYFSSQTRQLAVIVLATSAGSFFVLQDVRSETFLMSFYIFTVWQAALYHRHRRLQNLVLAVVGALLFIFSRSPLDRSEIHFEPIAQTLTLLFALAPWTLFLLLGVFQNAGSIFRGTRNSPLKNITLFTFIIPLILLCLNPFNSGYNVLILTPVGSVITADFLAHLTDTSQTQRLYRVQILLSFLILGLLFGLVWFPFPESNYFGLIHYMALLAAFCWLVFFSRITNKLLVSCLLLALGGQLVLNSYYYPNLLQYQSGSQLGMIAKKNGAAEGQLYSYQAGKSCTLQFYAGVTVQETSDFRKILSEKSCMVYTHQPLLNEFRALKPGLIVLASSDDRNATSPLLDFLNPKTRSKTLSKKVLIKW